MCIQLISVIEIESGSYTDHSKTINLNSPILSWSDKITPLMMNIDIVRIHFQD